MKQITALLLGAGQRGAEVYARYAEDPMAQMLKGGWQDDV